MGRRSTTVVEGSRQRLLRCMTKALSMYDGGMHWKYTRPKLRVTSRLSECSRVQVLMLASILVLSWDVGLIIADNMRADMSMRLLFGGVRFQAPMLRVGLRRQERPVLTTCPLGRANLFYDAGFALGAFLCLHLGLADALNYYCGSYYYCCCCCCCCCYYYYCYYYYYYYYYNYYYYYYYYY